MVSNSKSYNLNIILWFVFLILSIFIVVLNKTNNKFTISSSFIINNIAYKSYYYVYSIPKNLKLLTANKNYMKELIDKNNLLTKELNEALILKSQNIQLVNENNELKNILNVVNSSNFKMNNIITTEIYNKTLQPNKSYYNLRIGSKNNVKNNLAVVSNGFLLGRITDTTDNFSKVLLITNSNSRVSIITAKSNISAIMIGNGSTELNIITYEKDKSFINGEIAFTSGLGGIFPRNIPVGTIIKTKNNNWIVKPFVNLWHVDYVHIITN